MLFTFLLSVLKNVVFFYFYVMCMSVLPESMCMYYMHVRCLWRSKEEVRVLGTGVMGSCELPCGFWEPILGPVKEQQAFLSSALSFHPGIESSLKEQMLQML